MLARVAGLEEKVEDSVRRISQLEKNQSALTRLTTAVEVLATKQETVSDSVERLNHKMDAIEQRPGRRWESLTDKILLVLAGAFISFLLTGGVA